MKRERMRRRIRVGAGLLVAVLLSAAAVAVTTAPAGAATRGFDGKTITIGGMWSTSNFSGAQVGAEAYINQINKTNYLHGIKLKFAGFVNDKHDPATAFCGVRQLVNQYKVFALVPDLSAENPGAYMTTQKILYVGGGVDCTYCSTERHHGTLGLHLWRVPGALESLGRRQRLQPVLRLCEGEDRQCPPHLGGVLQRRHVRVHLGQVRNGGGQGRRLQGRLQPGQDSGHGQ